MKYEIIVDGVLKTTTEDKMTAAVAFRQECQNDLGEIPFKKVIELIIDDGTQKVFTRITQEADKIDG